MANVIESFNKTKHSFECLNNTFKFYAIHCETEEEANKLFSILESYNYKWCNDCKLQSYGIMYKIYKNQTCYRINPEFRQIEYGSREWYEIESYSVFNFKNIRF